VVAEGRINGPADTQVPSLGWKHHPRRKAKKTGAKPEESGVLSTQGEKKKTTTTRRILENVLHE